jgi:hypothetical protein
MDWWTGGIGRYGMYSGCDVLVMIVGYVGGCG